MALFCFFSPVGSGTGAWSGWTCGMPGALPAAGAASGVRGRTMGPTGSVVMSNKLGCGWGAVLVVPLLNSLHFPVHKMGDKSRKTGDDGVKHGPRLRGWCQVVYHPHRKSVVGLFTFLFQQPQVSVP